MKHSEAGVLPALLLLLTATACGAPGSELRVQRDTVGDTVIVRTLSGSTWGPPATLEPELRIGTVEGEDHFMFGNVRSLAVAPDGSIYVVDVQVPALRKYAPDGSYAGTFGREGGGPGEYMGPDGGLAVLDDGRVVLRDPGNARMQVYDPGGEPLATWPMRGGFQLAEPLVVDTAGRLWTQVLLDPTPRSAEQSWGMVAYDVDTGLAVDTVRFHEWSFEPSRLMARTTRPDGGVASFVVPVPFSPGPHQVFSPLGHMVGGLSTRYAIDQFRRDGTVLRVERRYDPVPVTRGEKDNREAVIRWEMRRVRSDWSWDGPAIPDEKPPFRQIYVGKDGRIWVLVSTPGAEVPDEQVQSGGPNTPPPDRWRELMAFDVFDPDGTYLGRVNAPSMELAPYTWPVFDGDRVWAVVRDESDIEYVVRYRVVRTDAEE